MPLVLLYLTNILVLAVPLTLYLLSSVKHPQKILLVVPEVKALAVEQVLLKVTVVVLLVGKYHQPKSITPSFIKRSIKHSVPHPHASSKLISHIRNSRKTFCYLQMVLSLHQLLN